MTGRNLSPVVLWEKLENLEKKGFITFLRGRGISKKDLIENGRFPCIHYGDLYTAYQQPTISEIIHRTNIDGKIRSCIGDVLIPATTTADEMGIAISRALNQNDVVLGGDINILRTKNKYLLASFLSYVFNYGIKRELASYAKGVNILHLSNKDIKKLCVPILPIPEQKRIVEKLDKIFSAIDNAKSQTEKNLQNAKDIFNNALHHTFFDLIQKSELMKLRDLLDITSSKRIFKHEYVEEGVPFYRTKEIKELAHGRSITLELFISRDKYQQIKEKFGVPQKNDLLVSAVGTIGEIYIVPDMNPFYFKDGNILWLKNYKRPILANYLKYALCSYISQIQALAKGTAYNALTIEKLADYRVPYINIDLQQNLILHLDTVYTKTQELEKIYTQKLADLEELKQAVLQQAFSGKL